MSRENDAEKLLRDVKYFNGKLYYKINCEKEAKKLLNNSGEMKKFIVVDVNQNKIFDQDEIKEVFINNSNDKIINVCLNTIKYKVYKQIKRY